MISSEEIQILNRTLVSLRNSQNIVSIVELQITDQQLQVICDPLFGFSKDELSQYYRSKIHCQLILKDSPFTTREDQPDFQYLFDLGVKALSLGIDL